MVECTSPIRDTSCFTYLLLCLWGKKRNEDDYSTQLVETFTTMVSEKKPHGRPPPQCARFCPRAHAPRPTPACNGRSAMCFALYIPESTSTDGCWGSGGARSSNEVVTHAPNQRCVEKWLLSLRFRRCALYGKSGCQLNKAWPERWISVQWSESSKKLTVTMVY